MTSVLQMAVKCMQEGLAFGLGARLVPGGIHHPPLNQVFITSPGPSLFLAVIFKDG